MSNDSIIWVVDDERSIRWVLEKALTQNGWNVTCFESAEQLLEQLHLSTPISTPKVVITDIRMPGTDGLELLSALKGSHPGLPVIVMTAHSDLDSAVTSIQGGAFEYLPKPFELDEAVAVVGRALAQAQQTMTAEPPPKEPQVEIIGKAPAMQEVFRAIGRLSKSNVSVLINGQSGTGKERVAHALHKHSIRAAKPFIPLNMAAIPYDLVESELFGHEKGAFTGANQRRTGRFEQAEGGTLFLDEIGDMPPETQTRLLRVLSDSEYYRVGGIEPLKANVRIIAATHQDLEELVAENKFREDLFWRINVIKIELPPLRERREDIQPLAEQFLRSVLVQTGREIEGFTKAAIECLEAYYWPGNVRELIHAVERAAYLGSGKQLDVTDLPLRVIEGAGSRRTTDSETMPKQAIDDSLKAQMAAPERRLILDALRQHNWRRDAAAKSLGINRTTLYKKAKRLGVDLAGIGPNKSKSL